MPFLQESGSVEAGWLIGRAGSGLPAASLIVDPDKVVALQQGIEQERDRVRAWLDANSHKLSKVPQPGADPCSEDSVTALGEHGDAALLAASGYLAQLQKVAEALGEIANAYTSTEEGNTGKFPWEPK